MKNQTPSTISLRDLHAVTGGSHPADGGPSTPDTSVGATIGRLAAQAVAALAQAKQ